MADLNFIISSRRGVVSIPTYFRTPLCFKLNKRMQGSIKWLTKLTSSFKKVKMLLQDIAAACHSCSKHKYMSHFYDMQFPKCFRYLRHILFGIRNFRLLSFRSHNVQIAQSEQVDARSPRRRLNRKISTDYLRSKIAILRFVSATSHLHISRT